MGVVWWIIGVVLFVFLFFFFNKRLWVFVVCPYCKRWDSVSAGTIGAEFECPGCRRKFIAKPADKNIECKEWEDDPLLAKWLRKWWRR